MRKTYPSWIAQVSFGSVSPQLRHRPIRKKQDYLYILGVVWPIHPYLVPLCLSSSVSPGHWHMSSVHVIQIFTTWTTCTRFHPGLWISGCHPHSYRSALPWLIPSDTRYLPQWLSVCSRDLQILPLRDTSPSHLTEVTTRS